MATLAIIKIIKQLDLNILHLQSQLGGLSDRIKYLENTMGLNWTKTNSSPVNVGDTVPNSCGNSNVLVEEIIDNQSSVIIMDENQESKIDHVPLCDDGKEKFDFEIASDPIEIPSDSDGSQDKSILGKHPLEEEQWNEAEFKTKIDEYLTVSLNSLSMKPKKMKLSILLEKLLSICKQSPSCPLKTRVDIQKWLESNMESITISVKKQNQKKVKYVSYQPIKTLQD